MTDTPQIIELAADEQPPLIRELTIWLVEKSAGRARVTVVGRLVTQEIPSSDWSHAIEAALTAAGDAGADRIYVTRLSPRQARLRSSR